MPEETPPPAKRGRPSTYTPELGELICSTIASRQIGIRQLCKKFINLPRPTTFYKWLSLYPEFAEQYARAKEAQMQLLEDEILDIADTPEIGEIVTVKAGVRESRQGDMLEHRKLRIETRKWLMGKLKPKKYGERTTLAGDKENPLHVKVDREELLAKLIGNRGNTPPK